MRRPALLLLLVSCQTGPRPAQTYVDERRPLPERLAALRSLRRDPAVHREIADALTKDLSRGIGMSPLSDEEAELLLEAGAWHAEFRHEPARMLFETYVDPEANRIRVAKLPDRVREGSARLLGRYAPAGGSRQVLWSALVERKEPPGLRQACLDALGAWVPDLRAKVLSLVPHEKDEWLRTLQNRLRG